MKLLLFLIATVMMLLTGCGKEAVLIPPVMPTDIITLADAQNTTDGTYKLKLNYDAVVEISDNVYRAEYLADPLGSGDTVLVTVTSPYGSVTSNDIKEMYKSEYKARLNKKKVEGLGNGAFLVFPSLYIYNDGYSWSCICRDT